MRLGVAEGPRRRHERLAPAAAKAHGPQGCNPYRFLKGARVNAKCLRKVGHGRAGRGGAWALPGWHTSLGGVPSASPGLLPVSQCRASTCGRPATAQTACRRPPSEQPRGDDLAPAAPRSQYCPGVPACHSQPLAAWQACVAGAMSQGGTWAPARPGSTAAPPVAAARSAGTVALLRSSVTAGKSSSEAGQGPCKQGAACQCWREDERDGPDAGRHAGRRGMWARQRDARDHTVARALYRADGLSGATGAVAKAAPSRQ